MDGDETNRLKNMTDVDVSYKTERRICWVTIHGAGLVVKILGECFEISGAFR